jgi:antitoxin component of MazEF toxin-antitoxin module
MYNMAIEVNVKKWGNSMGVLLPRELIRKERIEENDKIFIEVVKKADLSDIFGLIKNRKVSGQKFKDMAREGWES